MTRKAWSAGRSQVPGPDIERSQVNRRLMLGVLAAGVALWGTAALGMAGAPDAGAAPPSLLQVPAAGAWGKGSPVPGLVALSKAGNAQVLSVSCASAGNCLAGGTYTNRQRLESGFVALERNGRWGKAIEVPGLGALAKNENAQAVTVSCGSAGNCAVGGHYFADHYKEELGFLAAEQNGHWGKAVEMPGQAALIKGGSSQVASVSCGSTGTCTAAGTYNDRPKHAQGFVATERNGHWSKATGLPGPPGLGATTGSQIVSVSCGSAGNCAVGGSYLVGATNKEQVFVITEQNGHWRKAIPVPGVAALATANFADVGSVSCGAAGSCVVGGTYWTKNPLRTHGYVALEQAGSWGTATTVNAGIASAVSSVSCASATYCAASGEYGDDSGSHMFVASEENGHWDTPVVIANPEQGAGGHTLSLSCGSAGNCAVGGTFTGPEQFVYGFVAAERDGHWGTAIQMPRPGTLGVAAGTRVFSVTCVPAGPCTAGGYYPLADHRSMGFLVTHS